MSAAATTSTVAGDGVLARRASDLLFLPVADEAALRAYLAAPAASVVDAVSSCIEEQPDLAFAVVTWVDEVRIALHGDVELVSDHRSLPRLNAVGTGTWVERTLRTESVLLGVSPERADPVTSLDAGVVLAGGFALRLRQTASDAPTSPGDGIPAGDPRPDPTPEPVAEPVSDSPDEPDFGTTPESVSEPAEIIAERDPTVGGSKGESKLDLDSLVEAVARPAEPTIDIPDEMLANTSASSIDVEQPRWQLRFVDGPVEPVDTELVLGRKPTVSDGVRAVTVDCQKVSGNHLRITIDDGRLCATDLASRNKTWLVNTTDDGIVQLPANEPTELEAGAHLQIGSKVFVVEQRQP